MPTQSIETFLLASSDAALLAAVEPALVALGARVRVALTLDAALSCLASTPMPTVALLDESLRGIGTGAQMDLDSLTTALSAGQNAERQGVDRVAIVLISDRMTQERIDRVAARVIDDIIPRSATPAYWKLRIEILLRNRENLRELESLREAQIMNGRLDRLTGVFNRQSILTMLFRETDRVQRLKSTLSLLLLDVDDFGHWNSRLGSDACDDLLCQVATRLTRLLRSYDLLGRAGTGSLRKAEFLLGLPGCSAEQAGLLAERIRVEVFCTLFRVGEESIRLSACIGIASSHGRSPVVVLREAEQALAWAREAGPESVQCYSACTLAAAAPIALLSSHPEHGTLVR